MKVWFHNRHTHAPVLSIALECSCNHWAYEKRKGTVMLGPRCVAYLIMDQWVILGHRPARLLLGRPQEPPGPVPKCTLLC